MGVEIERKFLLKDSSWKQQMVGIRPAVIRQGYLNTDAERTVRVRLKDQQGYITIKGKTAGISRSEFEYPIPPEDAEALLLMCKAPLIEKKRYTVIIEKQAWEIDEFFGDNAGLVIAEAELKNESQELNPPSWIGEEVSHDRRYYNSNLSIAPFQQWQSTTPLEKDGKI